jgi:hypothetical protein
MLEKIKSNEPLYRAIRTFIQAFIAFFLTQICTTGFENLNKKAILTLIGSSLSAGISAVMNIKKNVKEDVSDNPETEEEIE